MSSLDWAAKAAKQIYEEIDDPYILDEERIAAIIATHAEPLIVRYDTLVLKLAALETWLGDLRAGEALEDCIARHIQRGRAIAARQAADPLVALLRDARREHHLGYLDDNLEPCPKSDEDALHGEECTCGADAWNARLDAVLGGDKVP